MQKKKIQHYLSYLALRSFFYLISLLPYAFLHKLGEKLGVILFFTVKKYRKRTLSNLKLATDLIINPKELIPLAKKSLGNLAITCLEYGKLAKENQIENIVQCINPLEAKKILSTGKGVIFLCAHQANWELFFLEGTSRMPGVAIGQPVKNTYLYNWILSIREKFGGKIVLPNQAVKEGLRALKQGKFLGIVGDQGMPGSGFSSPFLGREAWTSPLPALLSYRSGCPIITATMTRENGKYFIHYSDPIWPVQSTPSAEEIPNLMKKALLPLEDSIKKTPSQWLWQHNRWKQQLLGRVKKNYRQDAIAVLLPKNTMENENLKQLLQTFKEIYPLELLAFFSPIALKMEGIEEHLYQEYNEIEVLDYRYKLVFNFSGEESLSKHFLQLAALKAVNAKELSKEANLPVNTPLPKLLKEVLLYAH